MYKPIVGIFSSPGSLSVFIVEKLLENNSKVFIFSNKQNEWKKKTENFSSTQDFNFAASDKPQPKLDYAVFLSQEAQITPDDFIRKYLNVYAKETKCIFIFSYSQLSRLELGRYLPPNVGVIYVGDIVDDNSRISELIKLAYAAKPIKVSQDEIIYPIYKEEVGKLIAKWIFSFGPYGEEVAILSKEVPILIFLNSLKKVFPNLKVGISSQGVGTAKRRIKKFLLDTDLNLFLSKLFLDYQRDLPKLQATKIRYPSPKSSKIRKLFFPLLATLSIMILSPIFLLGVSILILLFAKQSLVSGDLLTAKRLLGVSKIPADIANKEASLFVKLPVVDLAYRPIFFFSETVSEISSIGKRTITLIEQGGELFSKVVGDEVFDPHSYSENITLELDLLFKDLAFLQSDIGLGAGQNNVISWLTKEIPIENSKSIILEARNIAKEIPEILGAGRAKTYLVLFQNNMELRPTGGFIGSFALVTFDGGRLTDINVQDVYSADGQLRGHVEPPTPIKDYLGEAGWYLRDANWDPDFPTSANKIEWFLNKEIDKTVDGVIAIDLEFTKSLLEEIGPLDISDFNTQVNSQNLYEKTQNLVETEFFPGSYKKTNFLTALSSKLLGELTNLKPEKRFEIVKATFGGLEGRHVQIFFHNKVAQSGVNNLGWSGAMPTPNCGGNCMADWFGIIEANVGVNKANYFIQREHSLSSEISSGQISHSLLINYQNKGNVNLGAKGKYKSYLRIAIPQGGTVKEIKLGTGKNLESVPFEEETLSGRREVGVLVEILPGQKKTVEIKWTQPTNLNLSSGGEYRLLWRKQAGTVNDSASINFKIPKGLNYSFFPDAFLTQNESISYNTNLARDFVSRIYWK